MFEISPDDRPKAMSILRSDWFDSSDMTERLEMFVAALNLPSSYDTLNGHTVNFTEVPETD